MVQIYNGEFQVQGIYDFSLYPIKTYNIFNILKNGFPGLINGDLDKALETWGNIFYNDNAWDVPMTLLYPS